MSFYWTGHNSARKVIPGSLVETGHGPFVLGLISQSLASSALDGIKCYHKGLRRAAVCIS